MFFNINDYVKVKLTQTGKHELIRQAKQLRKKVPMIKHEYQLPLEDENGWSKWQLHSLMEHFGNIMVVGCEPPFETGIEIIEKG